MFGASVNVLGVLIVAVISFILGFLWYGPLFGKQWLKLSKMPASEIAKAKSKSMTKPMILNFIGTIIMVFVFAQIINLLGASSVGQGIVLGFWMWLGFFASTTLLGGVLWENKPWGFYVLNGLYWLVNLMVSGALIVILS